MFSRMASSEADAVAVDELVVDELLDSPLSPVEVGIVVLRYWTNAKNAPSGVMSEVSISRAMAGVRTA